MNVFIINMKLVPYSFNLISYLDFFFIGLSILKTSL